MTDSEPSNWDKAVAARECPHCHNWKDLEQKGPEMFCPCCSRTFKPWTRDDLDFLKVNRIRPS